MSKRIFIEEYKNIKEVNVNTFNVGLINLNHDICETKKGLICLKKIKKVQLKYRVFKRKKYNFSSISDMIIDKFAHSYNMLREENLTTKQMRKNLNDFEIYAYELALLNDESREYEYDPRIDEGIEVYKQDLRGLKRQKRKLILNTIKNQINNLKVINKLDKMDKESLDSTNEKRILRRYLR